MDLQFVIEAPETADTQKKRPRLVTSCDHCRLKKIKCVQAENAEKCEGCTAANVPCRFRDREQYLADRSRAIAERTATSQIAGPPDGASSSGALQSDYSQYAQSSGQGTSQPLVAAAAQSSGTLVDSGIFDPARPNFPHPAVMSLLLQSFFSHLKQYFPFLNDEMTMMQYQTQTLSPLLENCIAAQASPYTNMPEINQRGGLNVMQAYLTQAKVLLSSAPLVSVDTLQAVILIAWGESKLNRITDFRAYADMAMRIATHLGLTDGTLLLMAQDDYERHLYQSLWSSVVQLSQVAATAQP